MQDIKLQLGCLVLILVPIVRYMRLSGFMSIRRSRLFMQLQAVALTELIFDASTAYTVNHPDVVPEWLNRILHWGFLVSLMGLVFCSLVYFMTMLDGDSMPKKQRRIVMYICLAAMLAISVTMPLLYYVQGSVTRYSMGVPVYICFAMIALVLVGCFIKLRETWDKINGFQRATAMMVFCSMSLVTFIQITFPETLISCMVPVLVILSATMNMEDPYMLHLYAEAEEMRKEIERINVQLSRHSEVQETKAKTASEPITLKDASQKEISLDPGDILYAEAEGNYITIAYRAEGVIRQCQLRQTMKNIEIALADNPRLMRVHRAFIVNLDAIATVDGNSQGYHLKLKESPKFIPVSRSYISAFNEAVS